MYKIRNFIRLVLFLGCGVAYVWSAPINVLMLDTISPFLPFDINQYPDEMLASEWIVIAISLFFMLFLFFGIVTELSNNDKPKKKKKEKYWRISTRSPPLRSKPPAPPPPPKLKDVR